MHDFSPGNSKSLDFVDKKGEQVWQIKSSAYPHVVRSSGDIVFFAFDYLSPNAIVYAYKAGGKDVLWQLDCAAAARRPLRRISLAVLGKTLFVQSNEHLFARTPSDGTALWHRNLATDLGLRAVPDLWTSAGIEHATMTLSKGVLLVVYDNRVIAIDVTANKILWDLAPHTFPHTPSALVHKGVVYLSTSGKRAARSR